MNKKFDIIIVGSGLTGNTCSLALAKAGYNIALIDPNSFGEACKNNNDTRTTALSNKAKFLFEELKNIIFRTGYQRFSLFFNNFLRKA